MMGELLSFTLCGTILRIVFINTERFGTSRGYDLSDPEDWIDVVKIIALFCGPISNYFPFWTPHELELITMETLEGDTLLVRLEDIEILGRRFDPYGRRTTVWSGKVNNIKQLDRNGKEKEEVDPRYVPTEDEVFVIKASWLLSYLAEHEKNVYRHIEEQDKKEGRDRDPEVSIPVFIGTVTTSEKAAETLGNPDLANWKTRDFPVNPTQPESSKEHACLSIFATKCFKVMTILGATISMVKLITVYRKLFKTLKYLAQRGVHYRDLNLGNILRDILTQERCLLTDFDFARIGMQRRGDPQKGDLQPWETSQDDCISGNPIFMSSFVQEGVKNKDTLERHEGFLLQAKQGLKEAKRQEQEKLLDATSSLLDRDAAALRRHKAEESVSKWKSKVEEAKARLTPNAHRYIDDCESAVYTLLWLVSTPFFSILSATDLVSLRLKVADHQRKNAGIPVPSSLERLDDLDIKKEVWQESLEAVSSGSYCVVPVRTLID
jgi:hypothetical protein